MILNKYIWRQRVKAKITQHDHRLTSIKYYHLSFSQDEISTKNVFFSIQPAADMKQKRKEKKETWEENQKNVMYCKHLNVWFSILCLCGACKFVPLFFLLDTCKSLKFRFFFFIYILTLIYNRFFYSSPFPIMLETKRL